MKGSRKRFRWLALPASFTLALTLGLFGFSPHALADDGDGDGGTAAASGSGGGDDEAGGPGMSAGEGNDSIGLNGDYGPDQGSSFGAANTGPTQQDGVGPPAMSPNDALPPSQSPPGGMPYGTNPGPNVLDPGGLFPGGNTGPGGHHEQDADASGGGDGTSGGSEGGDGAGG